MKFTLLTLASLCSVGLASAAVMQSNITAQELNQNSSAYVGKQVTLTGRVDRVLGNGSYIVSDGKNTKDPTHRVLIFTSAAKNQAGVENSKNNTDSSRQQAGVAAVTFKEGDQIKLNGKVEQFNVSSEVDSFSPKTDVETIDQSAATTPIVVIQPGSMTRY
jgi:DNA/RNA endonuclease YhcR with UshA esterase domain